MSEWVGEWVGRRAIVSVSKGCERCHMVKAHEAVPVPSVLLVPVSAEADEARDHIQKPQGGAHMEGGAAVVVGRVHVAA